jgi:DNA-directed RNA polymerase specialized sigma24 family protein
MGNKQSANLSDARPIDALLSIALQLRARLDASDGIQRNLGAEAVLLRGFGYKNPEIAAIIGSTPGSVAELISRAQKPAKEGKKRSKK